jgi:hypothetical protein
MSLIKMSTEISFRNLDNSPDENLLITYLMSVGDIKALWNLFLCTLIFKNRQLRLKQPWGLVVVYCL